MRNTDASGPARTTSKRTPSAACKTNIVTAVEIGDGSGRLPMFKPLVETTAENFAVEEVPADKAYLVHDNLALVKSWAGRRTSHSRATASRASRAVCGRPCTTTSSSAGKNSCSTTTSAERRIDVRRQSRGSSGTRAEQARHGHEE